MRLLLLTTMLLSACSMADVQPTLSDEKTSSISGEAFFQILLDNKELDLRSETTCPPPHTYTEEKPFTLGDQLSLTLSSTYNNKNTVSAESHCKTTKAETRKGQTVEAWDCQLTVIETTQTSEFVASSTIKISIDTTTKALIPGTVRCI